MEYTYSLCEKIRLMGVKFKPCPFCGEPLDDKPILIVLKEQYSDEYLLYLKEKGHIISNKNGYEVVCPFCGAKGSSDTNPLLAINKWNTRRNQKKVDEYGFNAEQFRGYNPMQLYIPIEDDRHCCRKCPCRHETHNKSKKKGGK